MSNAAARPRSRRPERRRDPVRKKLVAAFAMHQNGRLDQAANLYRRILDRDPGVSEASRLLGLVHLQQGDAENALKLTRRAVAQSPRQAEAHLSLGQALQGLGRLEEALESFRQAVRFKPGFAEAHHALGRVSHWLGRPEEAIASCRRAVAIRPDFAELFASLAMALREDGQIDAAIVAFARALELEPGLPGARDGLSIVRKNHFTPDRDLESARRQLAERSGSAEAHTTLGFAHLQLGTRDAALEQFHEAARIEPDHVPALYYMGLAHFGLGRLPEALDCIGRVRSIDKNDVFALAAEASIHAAAATIGDAAENARPKRVALHLNQRFHHAILRPVFDALRKHHHVLITPHLFALKAFDPDVVVVAESQAPVLRNLLPRALFVWTRHGLISKHTSCASARGADFACLTSEASRDWYVRNSGRPRRGFWITGYPQMDALFQDTARPTGLDLPPGNKTVLYAPTWTPGLSSGALMLERTAARIRGKRDDVSIIIKPHPVTSGHHPEWLAAWRDAAASERHVWLIDDPAADVVPYLQAADVLISDASSVVFQYLALDRPIVLITNPDHERSPY